ncbi:MAG: hypothetical protein ABSD10_02600 [Candidatus Saccharimonadales bacterium]|jgi:hypothetical protein
MLKDPESDYAAQPDDGQGRLPIKSAIPIPELEPSIPVEPLPPKPHLPPSKIRPVVDDIQKDIDFRRGIVDQQGQTTAFGTRERSKTLTPEDEDILIGRAARRVLASRPKAKRKKTRRGLGSRQLINADGPPPNVEDARKTY